MDFSRYAGHFHPVLVHLPIGILLAALLLEILSYRKGYKKLRKAVRILLFLGFISAFFSSLTGYLLSTTGEYDPLLLNRHKWLGIAVTAFSFIAVLVVLDKRRQVLWQFRILMLVIGTLLVITGHLGGSLTHGEDYLTFSTQEPGAAPAIDYTKISLRQAIVYPDLIAPVIDQKCKGCHGPARQKGKLRLDTPELMLKGGKDGSVLDSAGGRGSELVRRIQLDPSDEKHMPPKDKMQLTPSEALILSRWVEQGAEFTLKFSELPQADSLAARLAHPAAVIAVMEERKVAAPAPEVVKKLREANAVVAFRSQGNGVVDLNFSYADSAGVRTAMQELPKIRDQVRELKLNGLTLSAAEWKVIAQLSFLERLSVAKSNITDPDLSHVAGLHQLQFINLSGTAITFDGLVKLKGIVALKEIFLFETALKPTDADALHRILPGATIDFGNYHVPTLSADTTVLKKAYKP